MAQVLKKTMTGKSFLEHLNNDFVGLVLMVSALPRTVFSNELIYELVNLVEPRATKDVSQTALRTVKGLACVNRLLDGAWYISKEVRADLWRMLEKDVLSADDILRLRLHIAKDALKRAAEKEAGANKRKEYYFEAYYQLTMLGKDPLWARQGMEHFVELIKGADSASEKTLVRSSIREILPQLKKAGVKLPGWFQEALLPD